MVQVAFVRLRAKLPRPASDARRRWLEREAIAIAVSDGTHVGRAEAAPLPGFSPETLEHAERALQSIRWTEVDVDADDPLSLAALLVPEDAPSARFAVEAALLDLAGRVRGCSVASMLAEREPSSVLATAALVDDVESAVARARIALEAGAGALKVKVGRDGRSEDECAMLRALRHELGPDVRIRADANGKLLGPDDPRIATLADIDCELLEEPFPVEQLLASPPLPVPVAVDESLALDPMRARRALELGFATAVVLKPSLLGGIARSLALAETARNRGARVIVSHVYDAPRAFAACAHLALALGRAGDPPEVHGLARYAGLDQWVDDTESAIGVPRIVGAYRVEQGDVGGLG